MKKIEDYNSIIFLGGGVMAERLYNQIEGIEEKLIGVMDMLDAHNRRTKFFKDFEIQNADFFRQQIQDDDTAVLIAVGGVETCQLVRNYVEKYGGERNLYVANPYTMLRFFFVDEDLASEVRIPVTDKRYLEVEDLFQDKESQKTYNLLISSKPYESKQDTYEIIPYESIKDMYYMAEDYWLTYDFDGTVNENAATIMDCGAYIGDSILPICNKIPEKDITYYAFEPLKENADIIRNSKEFEQTCKRLEVLEYGVGEKNERLVFELPDNGRMDGGRFIESAEAESDNALEIRSLDDLNLDIQGTLYIKMDIEGSELGALKGCLDLIKNYHPYLAICLYHRKNDLLEIPLYIKSLYPDYDFYLRGGYHTILWAIPKNN